MEVSSLGGGTRGSVMKWGLRGYVASFPGLGTRGGVTWMWSVGWCKNT